MQSYNGYSYALNNPLSYKDPNGESLILAAAIIGGWIGLGSAMVSSDKSGWGLAGDMFKGLFVGAASGAAGAWAGGAIAGSITSLGFVQGSLSGMAGGFSSGFVGCAGNAWLAGAGFGQGLKAGFVGGGISGAISGIIGGLQGMYRHGKELETFRKGCAELNINEKEKLPVSDKFLKEAQETWFKDAPMENVKKFTVEYVPDDIQQSMAINEAGARTMPLKGKISGKFTGMSNVYFNKDIAFISAKNLYYTMGHEFVHVSQYAALAGQLAQTFENDLFNKLVEYHAYSYEGTLGGKSFNGFKADIPAMMTQYPVEFKSMNWSNFNFTTTAKYKYPF